MVYIIEDRLLEGREGCHATHSKRIWNYYTGNRFSGWEIKRVHKTVSDIQPNLKGYAILQKKERAKGFLGSVTTIT